MARYCRHVLHCVSCPLKNMINLLKLSTLRLYQFAPYVFPDYLGLYSVTNVSQNNEQPGVIWACVFQHVILAIVANILKCCEDCQRTQRKPKKNHKDNNCKILAELNNPSTPSIQSKSLLYILNPIPKTKSSYVSRTKRHALKKLQQKSLFLPRVSQLNGVQPLAGNGVSFIEVLTCFKQTHPSYRPT